MITHEDIFQRIFIVDDPEGADAYRRALARANITDGAHQCADHIGKAHFQDGGPRWPGIFQAGKRTCWRFRANHFPQEWRESWPTENCSARAVFLPWCNPIPTYSLKPAPAVTTSIYGFEVSREIGWNTAMAIVKAPHDAKITIWKLDE